MAQQTKKQRHGMGAKAGADARATTHPNKKRRQDSALARQSVEKARPLDDVRRKKVRLAQLKLAA